MAQPHFTRCPKCGHAPLPDNQALPAACPGCGAILAKLGQAAPRIRKPVALLDEEPASRWTAMLVHVPERVDATAFWLRVALLASLALWSVWLVRLDYRTGEFGTSFLHRPLLVFHEAGHVLFMPFGEWLTVAGGTLGQLLMPLILGGALLLKRRDPFGAAVGAWFFGVSLLDVAPYVYDALDPQLMLLSGSTGEAGGHDWIYLLGSAGAIAKAPLMGGLFHKAGALVVIAALAWAGWLLRQQYPHLAGDVLHEE